MVETLNQINKALLRQPSVLDSAIIEFQIDIKELGSNAIDAYNAYETVDCSITRSSPSMKTLYDIQPIKNRLIVVSESAKSAKDVEVRGKGDFCSLNMFCDSIDA